VDNEGLIVVGVDGSPSARTALQFALDEATRRSVRVRAVIAYRPPGALARHLGDGRVGAK
jgi:nucleotide-binding universal stress UspA family protein